jgi:hypothetical protein
MADENIDLAPTPVDPAVDPETPFVPSEISSGFYDNTPVDATQAENLQEVPPPVDPVPASEVDTAPAPVSPTEEYAVYEQLAKESAIANAQPVAQTSASGDPLNAAISAITGAVNGGTFSGALFNTNSSQSAITAALVKQAQQQQTLADQRKTVNNLDWRVRLRLAPGATYLYNAPNPGIMQPLKVSDGVIFPYTPNIDTAYKADYDAYTLTHSNYKGYFYKSSYVDAVNLKCTFTAQSTAEANYLLAVITFFKSVTKMFYGQDAQRGAPPPLVYLTGLGEYQFNDHPLVVSQFNFNLPSDVDYIRAGSPNNLGLNAITQRDRQSVSALTGLVGLTRLASAFLNKGALPSIPSPPTLGQNSPTYVPTKMDITLTLLPVQSRQQVSKQFSVKEFANGNLIKGGFW